jgi:hypothetical protein
MDTDETLITPQEKVHLWPEKTPLNPYYYA